MRQTTRKQKVDTEDRKIELFKDLTQTSSRLIPSLEHRAELNKYMEDMMREEKRRKDKADYAKKYIAEMMENIQRDIKNLENYFPEDIINARSPLFNEDT